MTGVQTCALPISNSVWKSIQAEIIRSQKKEQLPHRLGTMKEYGLEIYFSYNVNKKIYEKTGYMTVFENNVPPKHVEIIYQVGDPNRWEFAEDRPDIEGISQTTKVAIIWIWVLILLTGSAILFAILSK